MYLIQSFFFRRKSSGEIDFIEGETKLDNKDFKNTLKLTWLAETSLAPLTSVTCVHYDNIMTKAKLDENDKFEDFVNFHSQVTSLSEKNIVVHRVRLSRLNTILSANQTWLN